MECGVCFWSSSNGPNERSKARHDAFRFRELIPLGAIEGDSWNLWRPPRARPTRPASSAFLWLCRTSVCGWPLLDLQLAECPIPAVRFLECVGSAPVLD